jgi:predicted permease
MAWLHKFVEGLRALVRRDRIDRELDEELRSFVDAAVERHMADGRSRDQALRMAHRELGSGVAVREAVREIGWEAQVEAAWRDLVYAIRSFSRAPMFTVVAVLTLGIGIGASTAIFSIVHGVLLKPLPYTDSERIVRLYLNMPAAESPSKRPLRAARGLTAHQLEEVRAKVRAFSHAGTASGTLRGLPSIEEAARLQGTGVSASVFEMIGARPALGRVFTTQDEAPASPLTIILSHTAWQRYLGGDPNIVGTELAMDSVLGPRVEYRYTVIGVMPPEFVYPDRQTVFWLPFRTATPTGAPQSGPLVARLADGVSVEAALAELTPLLRALRPEAPETRYELAFDQHELVAPIRPAVLMLMAAVGFVLLIACVNVANLLLARSAARQREMAVRVAIGASRGRLIRQMLTESLLLAALGGIVGSVFAFAGVSVLKTMATAITRIDLSPGGFPRVDSIGVDATVLTFTLLLCLVTGLLFGIAPAILHSQVDPVRGLKGDHGAAQSRVFAGFGVRQLLVVAEVSLAIVLLVGGVLLSRSFFALATVNPGYDAEQVLTFQVTLPNARYTNPQLKSFAEDLSARLRAVPGVQSVAYSNQLPMVNLTDTGGGLYFTPDASRPPTPLGPEIRLVSRDYLKVFGTRVLAGRGFQESDDAGRPRAMLVNQATVNSFFSGENPIGRQVFVGRDVVPWEIVGIVEDVRQYGLDRVPSSQYFVDLRQWTGISVVFPVSPYFALRAGADLESLIPGVRDVVRAANTEAALFNVTPMTALVANNIARPKLYAVLLGAFGFSGLALALIGIYGVMAYTVTQRTREIGIRMSLGAAHRDVLGLVMRQSLMLTATGVALGLVGAALASRYVEALLFGVKPLDAGTFASVAVVFVVVAGLAAYLPARRAARVDPLIALRCE